MANLDPNARFERQRLLAKQEQNQANQEATDAMQRRMAASGRLNSGAAIKGEQKIQQAGNEVLSKRLGAITDAQEGEQLRREEIQEGRKFQTSEREASQMFGRGEREASQLFGADQARLGREFSRSERLGGQEFASAEAGKQRGFMTSEREAGQKFASGEAAINRDFSDRQSLRQQRFQKSLQDVSLKQQASQFDKQFELDERVTQFNMDMADNESNDWFSQAGRWGTKTWKNWFG